MTASPITFHSEGYKLVGDLYTPGGLRPGEPRAGIVLCHGYTGVKDLYLPDNARALVDAGYVVLAFDYKGWGESEGPRTRLAPYSRVADAQTAERFHGSDMDSNRGNRTVSRIGEEVWAVILVATIFFPLVRPISSFNKTCVQSFESNELLALTSVACNRKSSNTGLDRAPTFRSAEHHPADERLQHREPDRNGV